MALLLVLFFQLWRVILLFQVRDAVSSVPSSVLAESFLAGLRFDFAVACYITVPLLLLGMLLIVGIGRSRLARRGVFVILTFMSGAAFFINLVDIEFFRYFNNRLNGSALLWADSPAWMTSMIWETYPVIRYLIVWLIVWACFTWLARRLMDVLFSNRREKTHLWVDAVWMIGALVLLGTGARGRLAEKAPLRWGVAYFCEYDLANQLALNPVFTLVHDAIYFAHEKENLRKLMDEIAIPEPEVIARSMLGLSSGDESLREERLRNPVRPSTPNSRPPNVILIIMESFGAARIGALDNRYPYQLSPCFDSLSRHGLLFTDFYSCGAHTFTGLFCSLMGYPHLVGKLLLKQVPGHNRFYGLPSILRDHGYRTLFFTTHDPHFDNMQGFLMANGVQRIISVYDYDPDQNLSTLGVPDHVMFDRALDELRSMVGNRFFATLLTASNHGPWLIPDVDFERLPNTDRLHEQLNAFKYSDWALGRFLSRMSRDSAFENTLVVVTADNGLLYKAETDLDPTQFHVPLWIYNTDWKDQPGARIARLGSQLDIPATVMGLIGLGYDNYTFGSDLLDTMVDRKPFAYFSEWYKIGLMQDDYFLIERLRGPRSLYRRGDCVHDLADSLPEKAEQYARLAHALFQTAYINMQRPLGVGRQAEK